MSENMQIDETIELYKKSLKMNEAHIQDLRGQNEFLRTMLEQQTKDFTLLSNEPDEVAKLKRANSACSEIINDQIKKYKTQIDSDAEQLKNQIDIIKKKDEQIYNLQIEVQNMTNNHNKTQVELIENKNTNLEDKVISCIPFGVCQGIYKIKVPGLEPFDVICGGTKAVPGWILIHQKINGEKDFNRDWDTYMSGFGSFQGNFFLGLEKIYRLTANQPHELLIYLEDLEGQIAYAFYGNFAIADEDDEYKLIDVDGFSGNVEAGDFMNNYKGSKFSTFDNGSAFKSAEKYAGGWWYTDDNKGGWDRSFGNNNEEFAACLYALDYYKSTKIFIRPKFV